MRKAKILIVDDEEYFAILLKDYLEDCQEDKAKYQIETAFDLSEAIDKTSKLLPDLIITDLRLEEDLEGLGIFDYLQENGHDIPVIIVTAFGDKDNLLKCIPKRPHYIFEKAIIGFKDLKKQAIKILEERQNKDENRLHLNRVDSLLNKLPENKHFNLVRKRLQKLTPEQYKSLEKELPSLKSFIEKRGEEKSEINCIDKEREAKGLIPLSLINKGTVQLSPRYYTSRVTGEKKTYHYFYLHWVNEQGKEKKKELGKLEKITDPLILEKIYAKYPDTKLKRFIKRIPH